MKRLIIKNKPSLTETQREKIRSFELWQKNFHERVTFLLPHVNKAYKNRDYGAQFKKNFEAALKDLPPLFVWDKKGKIHARKVNFVSQINPEEAVFLDSSDDEDGDEIQTAEPAEAEEEVEDEGNGDLGNAPRGSDHLLQDVVDENLDADMGHDEADRSEAAEQDLEDEEVGDENLGAGETSADDLEEGSDAEIIHEIRVKRPGGTLQDLKEITIILEF
jgi:hypothetical protein